MEAKLIKIKVKMASDSKKSVKSYLQKHRNVNSKSNTNSHSDRNDTNSVGRIASSSKTKTASNVTSKMSRDEPKPSKNPSSKSKWVDSNVNHTKSSYMRHKAVIMKYTYSNGMDSLPDEIFLKIFEYLSPNDLLCCASVSKRWMHLAKDNLLWERVYKTYARKKLPKAGQAGMDTASKPPGQSYWRSLCIKKCKELREKKVLPLVSKLSPFTGLSSNTETALKKSGVRWLLCFEDNNGQDHVIDNSDVFYFNMSVCVRWYALVNPPLHSIKKVKIYSGNPVFFDDKRIGDFTSNSPCQRSLLFSMEFRWSEWKSKNPHGGDEMVDIHIVPGGLAVACFKDGNDIAFMTANLHIYNLVPRCLLGSSTNVYKPLQHPVIIDDIDSKYGLHDFTCTIELRNQRTSFWNQQFRNLYTKEGDMLSTHAKFILLDPNNDYERSSVAKKISFLWKTDIFKGCIPDLCFMDLTLLDERQKPMWCVSSAVKLITPEIASVSYAFDGDQNFIEYEDNQGKVVMKLVWEQEEKQYFMVGLEIFLSLGYINQWFGTKY